MEGSGGWNDLLCLSEAPERDSDPQRGEAPAQTDSNSLGRKRTAGVMLGSASLCSHTLVPMESAQMEGGGCWQLHRRMVVPRVGRTLVVKSPFVMNEAVGKRQ